MPVFSVTVTHRIEESVALEIRAENDAAARANVEQFIEQHIWQELTMNKNAGEVSVDTDELTIEEVTEE